MYKNNNVEFRNNSPDSNNYCCCLGSNFLKELPPPPPPRKTWERESATRRRQKKKQLIRNDELEKLGAKQKCNVSHQIVLQPMGAPRSSRTSRKKTTGRNAWRLILSKPHFSSHIQNVLRYPLVRVFSKLLNAIHLYKSGARS